MNNTSNKIFKENEHEGARTDLRAAPSIAIPPKVPRIVVSFLRALRNLSAAMLATEGQQDSPQKQAISSV